MYSNPPMDYHFHTPSYHPWSIPPTYPTNPSFTSPTTPSFPSFPWELFTPCYTHVGSSSPKLYLNHGYSPNPPHPNPYSSSCYSYDYNYHQQLQPTNTSSTLFHQYQTHPRNRRDFEKHLQVSHSSFKKNSKKNVYPCFEKTKLETFLSHNSPFQPHKNPNFKLPSSPNRWKNQWNPRYGNPNPNPNQSESFVFAEPENLQIPEAILYTTLSPLALAADKSIDNHGQYSVFLNEISLDTPQVESIHSTTQDIFSLDVAEEAEDKDTLLEPMTPALGQSSSPLLEPPDSITVPVSSLPGSKVSYTKNSWFLSIVGLLLYTEDISEDKSEGNDVEEPELSLPSQIDMKKKKLLVLNLNGFLIRKVHILDFFRCIFIPSRVIDYRFLHTILFKRPFREEVIKFCSQRFEVKIWSSAVKKNVCGALTCTKGGYLVDKLLFIWAQFHCQKYEDEFKGFLNDCVVTLGSIVYGIVGRVTYMEHLADHHGKAILMKSILKPAYHFDQLLALDFKGNIPIACSEVQGADELVDCFKMDDLGLFPEEDPQESLNITDGESKEKGNVNAKSIENLKPIVPPSNGGTRQPLERTSTSTNVLEKSHVISKIEDSELIKFYDEIVQDMEEILLESRDSSAARFSMGSRMLDPLVSMPSRDGGLTVFTSSADDAYLLFQRPRRIYMIEVVGARQKTGDVSFSERLVEAGCVSLARHLINSNLYGANVIVAINKFSTDTAAELNDSKCNGKVVVFQNDLVNIQVIEDDPRYWEVMLLHPKICPLLCAMSYQRRLFRRSKIKKTLKSSYCSRSLSQRLVG